MTRSARPNLLPFAFCLLPFAFVLLFLSCGYHVSGTADVLPKNVKTIAIPAFGNITTRYKLSDVLSAAVTREFISRTRYQVVTDVNSADKNNSRVSPSGSNATRNVARHPMWDATQGAMSTLATVPPLPEPTRPKTMP